MQRRSLDYFDYILNLQSLRKNNEAKDKGALRFSSVFNHIK